MAVTTQWPYGGPGRPYGSFAGKAPAPVVSKVIIPGGGHFIAYPEPEKKKREFTKKDENELKRLLLRVAEDEKRAQEKLEQKARSLRDVENAAEGIQSAIRAAEVSIRQQARQKKISWEEAQKRIQEIDEEEDLLLILLAL